EKDGSWKHQLDAQNKLSTTIWDGKPDIYHASQTLLLSNFRYSFAKTLKKQTFNILVIGELIVDITISDKGEKRYLGGSPCNVALTLSRLNMPPTLLTTYNPQDELGKFVNEKIDLDDIKIDLQINEQTNRSMVYLDDDFNASYSFVYSSNITPNSFDVDYLSLGSISAFQLENNQSKKFQDFTKKAHQAGVITFFDPNIRKEINPPYEISKEIFNSYLPYIDYLKASNEDIDFLYPNTDYFKVAINLFSLGIKLFILTKGESGAILYYQENKQVKSIALSCVLSKVIDTIGAGDSFMGAFIYYIIKYKPQQNEKELKELLLFCLKVASITVSREGANPPYLCELNDKTECSVLTKQ
ncbi:MAG: PfkB family carbohydrate kinase, partial [Bacillales bacterium]|nr:PfkB family carbohydrate kinase [Bacillales bacterium]